MTPRIIGDFADGATVEDVFKPFRGYGSGPEDYEADAEVLLARLRNHGYEEDVTVVFRSRSTFKLYSVGASHCSCYGFEGQWCPVETTVPALRFMVRNNDDGEYRRAVNALCDELVSSLEVM